MWWWKVLVVAAVGTVHAASRDQWLGRSVYQVVTDRFARSDNSTTASCDAALGEYCGGSLQGIITKLDYIQELGFDAVWISPVQSQESTRTADLSAYHGYWPNDLYSINSHFGTSDDLQALSAALHARGMYLMLDIIVGDMAWAGNASTVDYSTFNPFNDQKYFHDYKLLSEDPINDTCVLDCWMGDNTISLPDLRNEDQEVQQMLGTWVSQLVSNYSIDGLRIDSVLNIAPTFFSNFSKSAGIFTMGEGATRDAYGYCSLQPSLSGLLNYPLYYILTEAFNTTNGDLTRIVQSIDYIRTNCEDVLPLGTFTSNQDVPRFGSYTSDISLARNILTISMIADGIPILYYGEEQHLSGGFNPVNREALWLTKYSMNSTSLPLLVQSLNRIRSYASGDGEKSTVAPKSGSDYLSYLSLPIYNSTNILATRKGFSGNQVVSVVSNLGAKPATNATTKITLGSDGTGFSSRQNVTEILSCKTFVTDAGGNLNVDLSSDGGPRVYYPTKSLKRSTNICGDDTRTSTTSSASPKTSTSGENSLFGLSWEMRTLVVTIAVTTSFISI
ncbi:Alpha-amylase, fungi [Penicillium expansum]|uniref:alpha-amylase n=1 Tax=Penicillium expansum TaxID=27334 RepID=A0A0A2KWC5_PENEN|nr:Alpha-amylase, fungi [Penicillium expansum]KGO45467.1 Alpha-amylase, fungi [Penicillium expansum]KGO57302.1 Alpha-amylase, fungi [Penicillium expansum]KGO71176.1 Alpha-amylase, fungi [Penicillium expansum]